MLILEIRVINVREKSMSIKSGVSFFNELNIVSNIGEKIFKGLIL